MNATFLPGTGRTSLKPTHLFLQNDKKTIIYCENNACNTSAPIFSGIFKHNNVLLAGFNGAGILLCN